VRTASETFNGSEDFFSPEGDFAGAEISGNSLLFIRREPFGHSVE
jgi:hypothetical protein